MVKETVPDSPVRSLGEFSLGTRYTSREVATSNVDLSTKIAQGFTINIPLTAAAMQAVSNDQLSAELARCGGIGVIPQSLPKEDQAEMVAAVKSAGYNSAEYTYPLNPLIDDKGKLRVGAAINTHDADYKERVPILVDAGVDILFIDSAHGNREFQEETLKFVRDKFPEVPIVGGNIITEDGFETLRKAGALGMKEGMGVGSMCITTDVKATGYPSHESLVKTVRARDEHYERKGEYFPMTADGGINNSRTMCNAFVFGADAVMMGWYFARFEEAPGKKFSREKFLEERFPVEERVFRSVHLDPSEFFKEYWGEGSARVRKQEVGGKRYGQTEFDEGVDGFVPYAGGLREGVRRTLLQIASSMQDNGALNLEEFRNNAEPIRISHDAATEAGVHDMIFYSRPNTV